MTYDILEVSWIAGGLFFGIGQALIVGIISFVPKGKDDLIEYYLSIPSILPPIYIFSFVALSVPIIFSWVHCVNECNALWFILSSILTILAVYVCYLLYSTFTGAIIQNRLLSLYDEI